MFFLPTGKDSSLNANQGPGDAQGSFTQLIKQAWFVLLWEERRTLKLGCQKHTLTSEEEKKSI